MNPKPFKLFLQLSCALALACGSLSVSSPGASAAPQELGNKLGMLFRLIPAGRFDMGTAPEEMQRYAAYNSSQEVQHPVTLSKPYYIQKTEVTQAQWQAVMGNNPSQFKGDPNQPVERVSWPDVQQFITKLNQRGDGRYRLPTEAEWEYAAWAGDASQRDFSALDQWAWYDDNSEAQTHAVAQKEPNAWGLYDMLGNVWEWVGDYYGPFSATAVSDPAGPAKGTGRVLRGGSWKNVSALVRPSARCCQGASPNLRNPDVGFRLVRIP